MHYAVHVIVTSCFCCVLAVYYAFNNEGYDLCYFDDLSCKVKLNMIVIIV